jgi:hypothetical protein
MSLTDTFTSTGAKFFAHQEAMEKLRNGRGQPITTHVMLTDRCQHTCAFCSVQARAGDSLPFSSVTKYVDILLGYGLKSVILSGGGNPILYKCKDSGANFNNVVSALHHRGLEIGLITNGMPLRPYQVTRGDGTTTIRESWGTVHPDTLDKLTWVRVSMSGLDHDENEVYVPDVDPKKTTLGMSYVAHDIYDAPEDKHHGKVSTEADLLTLGVTKDNRKVRRFDDRMQDLTRSITFYADTYKPRYVRLLPNCLEPKRIPERCAQLQDMAETINSELGSEVVFVQYKPPAAPHVCLLGAVHPVLNSDGFCYPCDSCVLNDTAGHQFANPWRMCHWSEIGKLYDNTLPHSLIKDPSKQCSGCVFNGTNKILEGVRDGVINPIPPLHPPEHVNFV